MGARKTIKKRITVRVSTMSDNASEPGATQFVATITEVSQTWHKHRKSVEWALLKRKLKGRQAADRTYLVDIESVYALWGEPPTDEPTAEEFDPTHEDLPVVR